MSKKSVKSADTDNLYSTIGYDPEPYYSIMDLFFEKNSQVLVKHHIDSYNQFTDEIIPSIISGENIIFEKITETKHIKYRLDFEDYGPRIAVLENEEGYMYPHDAMQKKLSYSAPYVSTITQYQDIIDIATGHKETNKIGKGETNVPFAKIPIMVGSNLDTLKLKPDPNGKHCRYDPGGYFIVNGSEKVVLSVESMIDRKPMVFAKRDQNSYIYYVQVRSRPSTQFVGNVQTFSIKIKKDNSIVLDYKQFKEIPIFTLIRALGIETDYDIIRTILDVDKETSMLNFLMTVLNNPANTTSNIPLTTEAAIESLMYGMRSTKIYSGSDQELHYQQKRIHLMKILSQYILPHVTSGTNDPKLDMLYKAYYICYMIHKLLKCYLKENKDIDETRGCDDRDAMYNKRIELTGILLGSLFEQSFKKMLSDCGRNFRNNKGLDDKNPPNVIPLIKPNTIEQGLRQALSQGIFGSQARKGLSQMFSRLNHSHSASYLRRIITPTADASTNKMTAPRHLHVTHFNKICPLESPEGPKTGLMKHLALLTTISIAMNHQIPIIMDAIRDMITPLESINLKKYHKGVKVFLNGNQIGITTDIIKMHSMLREKRFKGEIEKTVGLVLNYREKEFKIYTEGGRLVTPYLAVDSKTNTLYFKPEMVEQVTSWDELLSKFPYVIEYLDCEEELNMMLAIFPTDIDRHHKIMKKAPPKSVDDIDHINRTNRYDGHVFDRLTHCLVHPCSLLGTIVSNIPFTNHNYAVRGIFGYNQQKQAMGLYISDYRERCDISYILYHTQIPLVASKISKYTGTHIFPAGENTIVAIMSYDGWNQEDSIIVNKSSVDRGLFRALSYKKYQDEVKKNPATSQPGVFAKPDKNKVDTKDANYEKLSADGYVKAETPVKDGDVLICMINPKASPKVDEKQFSDSPNIYKSVVPGTVERVFIGHSGEGYAIIKMRVRSERIPIMGDKFSCYDDKTEVLTNKGWILFKNLNKDHQVATLTKDNNIIYEKPIKLQKYNYDGQMYCIESDHLNVCVTPNHDMWVRTSNGITCQKEKAENIIGLERYYQKNANSMYHNNFEYVDDMVSINNEYIFFKNRQESKFYTKEIMNVVAKWLVHPDMVHNPLLSNCKDSLPEWIWGLNGDHLQVLINNMGNSDTYNFSSETLANDFQRLCLHAGYSCNIKEINSGVYSAQVEKINNNPLVNSEKSDIKDKSINYNGYVYCCTTTSGVIYVRRNGVPVWCGNSYSGQKGTCGLLLHRADMPYCEDGVQPDFIINPNCINKRMTLAQLIECLFGKLCAVKGIHGDGTPFMGIDINKVNAELVEYGMEEWGNQTMYCGMTGKKLATKIFIGPTYYQRLKQMVGDKVHSRSNIGPKQLLTRQPSEGRTRDGGFRLGEMERDVLGAHGTAQMLKERTVDNSDSYTFYICDICGLEAHKVPNKKHRICKPCGNTTKISQVIAPYAFVLLSKELRAINIDTKIRTSKSINVPKL